MQLTSNGPRLALESLRASFGDSGSRQQTVTPRKPLFGGRAVLGGLLIALAVIGSYLLATGSSAGGRQPFVVMVRDVSPGSRIQAADITTIQMSLTDAVARQSFDSTGRVVGAITLSPLRAGQLVQAASLSFKQSDQYQPEVSFSIPSSRAVGGELRPGETVDVLTTDKGSPDPPARTAVTGAVVVRIAPASGNSIGRSGELTVTLALQDKLQASTLIAAVDSGPVTLIRTTGLPIPSSQSLPQVSVDTVR